MRACGGVWVAQASGDADREMSDEAGRIGLPQDDPRYLLRRVWLSKEEEAGYYLGFANEGLWPLCHIVHTRPQFRPEDWAHYKAVNEKFAAAILAEAADVDSPLILIQDYHFALLPGLIKRERPDARVALFWHIPWPNAEAFGICPWQHELLLGMLGADLVGFHTQYYCNNFLETAERAIEARVEWEQFAVTRGQRTTLVKPFPISVAPEFVPNPPDTLREDILRDLGISCEFLGVGVERLDYTKGLPERIRAVGRFFELNPEYRERLVFVQLAAPSRSSIARYQEIEAEVDATVREVNTSLATRKWRPVLYLKRHHDHREIWPFYRYADFCMVTSLHDGMGISPFEFLVLPRMLGLILMMPLLTIYADLVGILGGAVVGVGMLKVGIVPYWNHTWNAASLADFAAGMIKSVVFGILIAIAGCMRGMQSGRSSAAVGLAATSAVVTAIVFVIVSDAILTVVYDAIGF